MDEDQLIRQFMQAHREDISDSGFSDRVMRHIPADRPAWMTCATIFLALAALAVLFIWFDGWSVLCSIYVRLYTAITYAKHLHFTFNPVYLLVFLGLGCWLLSERIKKIAYNIRL